MAVLYSLSLFGICIFPIFGMLGPRKITIWQSCKETKAEKERDHNFIDMMSVCHGMDKVCEFGGQLPRLRTTNSHFIFRVASRVTSLGEFSPIGWLLTLGSFLMTEVCSSNLWTTFSQCISNVSILTKNGLSYIFGEFFTNSSGHPGRFSFAFRRSPS
jgi:hypothetical protein